MANSNKIHPRMIKKLGIVVFIYLFNVPEGENRPQNGFVCVRVFLFLYSCVKKFLEIPVSIPNKDSGVNSLAISLYLKMCRREIVRQPV